MNDDLIKLQSLKEFIKITNEYYPKTDSSFLVLKYEENAKELLKKHVVEIGIDLNYITVNENYYIENNLENVSDYIDELNKFHLNIKRIFDNRISISEFNYEKQIVNGKLDLTTLRAVKQFNRKLESLKDRAVSFGVGNDYRKIILYNTTAPKSIIENPYLLFSKRFIKTRKAIPKKVVNEDYIYYLNRSETEKFARFRKPAVKKLMRKSKRKNNISSILKYDKVNALYEIISAIIAIYFIIYVKAAYDNDSTYITISLIVLLVISFIYKLGRFKLGANKAYRSLQVSRISYLIVFGFALYYLYMLNAYDVYEFLIYGSVALVVALILPSIENRFNLVDLKFIIGPMLLFMVGLDISYALFIMFGSPVELSSLTEILNTSFKPLLTAYALVVVTSLILRKVEVKRIEKKQL